MRLHLPYIEEGECISCVEEDENLYIWLKEKPGLTWVLKEQEGVTFKKVETAYLNNERFIFCWLEIKDCNTPLQMTCLDPRSQELSTVKITFRKLT